MPYLQSEALQGAETTLEHAKGVLNLTPGCSHVVVEVQLKVSA